MDKDIREHYVIKSADQLKAINGPVRLSIFKHLTEKPWTALKLAEAMKVKPTKLYYHLNTMQKHGLIAVVGTSTKRNFVEKTYRAVAKNFKLDDKMLRASKGYVDAVTQALRGVFDATERDVDDIRMRGRDPFSPSLGFVAHSEFRLSAKDGLALQNKLYALQKQFDAKSGKKGEVFCLSVVYYPKDGRPLVGVKPSDSGK